MGTGAVARGEGARSEKTEGMEKYPSGEVRER